MRKLEDLKNEVINDAKNSYKKKDKNFFLFLFAFICILLAIIVPVAITNEEVKEARRAEAEAAKEALEQARQAAIEAEKKAEEQRNAALQAALLEEQAAAEAQAAAEEAAEKARQERKELLDTISTGVKESVTETLTTSVNDTVIPSMQSIIDVQTDQDFSTQYSIQDELIQNQKKNSTAYQDYIAKLLSLYAGKYSIDVSQKDEESLKRLSALMDAVFEEFLSQDAKSEDIHESVRQIIEKTDAQSARYEADQLTEQQIREKIRTEEEAARIRAEKLLDLYARKYSIDVSIRDEESWKKLSALMDAVFEEFLFQDEMSEDIYESVRQIIKKTDAQTVRYEADQLAEKQRREKIQAEKEAARIAAEKEAARIAAEEEAARIRAEKEKWNSHYNRFNRIEIIGSINGINLQYLRKTGNHFAFGLKTGYIFDSDKDLLVQGSADYIFVDNYKFNVALDSSIGIAYSFVNKEINPVFEFVGVLRFTLQDGCELSFRPGLLIETNFSKTFKLKASPFTIGASLTF